MTVFLKCQPTILVVFFSALCLLLFPSLGMGGAQEQMQSIDWEHFYKKEGYSFDHEVVFLHEGNEILYIAGTYGSTEKTKSPSKVDGIRIWGIDSEGKSQSSLLIQNSEEPQTYFQNVEALSVSKQGEILIVVQSKKKEATLLKLSPNGDRIWTTKLQRGRHVSKILLLKDGTVLLLGHELMDPMILEIDNSGALLQSKILDRGKSDFFVDGLLRKNGGFVVLENSGKLMQFYMGPSTIWISVFNSKIEKEKEQQFVGRNGNLIASKGNGYFAVYDRSDTCKQEIHVKRLGEDFEELWDLKLIETPFGLGKFKIARLQDGGILVAGAINGKNWIGKISSDGKLLKEFKGQSGMVEKGTDLRVFGNDLYLVSTVIHVTDQKKVNNQIKVVKLKAP